MSRGTLNRWQRGDYSMRAKTRRLAVEWLGQAPVNPGKPLTEGQEKLIAANWMHRAADQLRQEALAATPTGEVEAAIGAVGQTDTMAETSDKHEEEREEDV